ncbi:MAG: FG-GAP-like repeat-containing protein [Terriglobales bacterium]
MKLPCLICLFLLLTAAFSLSQSGPVPLINQPLVPDAVVPGSTEFKLTVNGTGFVPASVVNWNGTALVTTFVSGGQLTASVPASNVATSTTASITVSNSGNTQVASNPVFFPVTNPTTSVTFGETVYPTGDLDYPLTIGDFRSRGILDLVVGNSLEDTASILLGKGDGTFQRQRTFNAGGYPVAVITSDFNGDGKLDLALADQGFGDVSILLGNGDGTFQPAVTFPTGETPDSVFAADFNGDGKLDLALTNHNDATVSILLGNGDGTFQPQKVFNTGDRPNSVIAADFNRDGILDLAVGNTDGTVSILLGNGDGSFQSLVAFPAGDSVDSIVAADFNGDGILDLAVSNYVFLNSISILLGNGDGTFQAPVSYPAGSEPLGIAAADFNGDGNLDLAVANNDGIPSSVSILLGNGDGTFQPQLVFLSPNGASGIAAGDFNRDGRMDVAVTNPDGPPNSVSVLLQSQNTAATETTLVSSRNPSLPSQHVTFTATVTSSSGTATGDVAFMEREYVLAIERLRGGSASFTASSLPSGARVIYAIYEGSLNSSSSVSQPLNQLVLTPTTTTLSSSPNPSSYGEAVTLTAVVTWFGEAPPDGEIVTFVEDLTELGSAKLKDGMATLTTSSLPLGTHPITAVYAGDSEFGGSSAPWLRQVVKKAGE